MYLSRLHFLKLSKTKSKKLPPKPFKKENNRPGAVRDHYLEVDNTTGPLTWSPANSPFQ